jgi:hypothetical protein
MAAIHRSRDRCDTVGVTHTELRQILLDALDRLACPAGHAELDAFARVFHGVNIAAEEVEALLLDEQQAFRGGEQRQVWICPAVAQVYPDFPPDTSLLTRSDWPLARRLLLPASSALRQLWLVRKLSILVLIALEEDRPNIEPLMGEVSRRAELLLPAGIVEARVRRYRAEKAEQDGVPIADVQFDVVQERIDVFREVAEDAFEMLAPADHGRHAARPELEQASPEIQLFGTQTG